MGVDKKILQEGDGVTTAKQGDVVNMEYTGYLYDTSQAANSYKGKKFDSSIGRGDFKFNVGEGKVIKGWDEGILGTSSVAGMTLGEKATLTISPDYAYGDRGFPGHIPPSATLVFDVELKSINNRKAS